MRTGRRPWGLATACALAALAVPGGAAEAAQTGSGKGPARKAGRPGIPDPGALPADAPVLAALRDIGEIIFAVREPGKNGHYYVNFGNWCGNQNKWEYGRGGRLCRLDVRSGAIKILIDDPPGGVRDPQVHYDGRKILLSYRPGKTNRYHLYEIGADGSGLRRLTDGDFDDIEPTWLPDGRIMFCSTRCNRIVNCNLVQVALLFTCDGDGRDIRQISPNVETENTPWPMPDGRVLYTRWEYVDRSIGGFKALWTVNPDGTGVAPFLGNMRPRPTYLDAKPIPGGESIVLIHSEHMGREHVGAVAVFDPSGGPDDHRRERVIHRDRTWRDPYPIGQEGFLLARESRIVAMDYRGRTRTVYELPEKDRQAGLWCHEPRPLQERQRERVLPDRVDLSKDTGTFLLADAHLGRNMEGMKPGEIRSLLVIETLPKPANFSGRADPYGFDHSFTLERVLGTVPVEPDGSAHFEAPANRALFFVALDAAGLAVKRMHSFTAVQPGEVAGCVGCHEPRTSAYPSAAPADRQAFRRPASRIEPVPDAPEVFDYPRDIQPIWDRHCVACHDYDATARGGPRAGGVILTGDRGPVFSHSYATLHMRDLVVLSRDGRGDKPPRAVGSGGSPLVRILDGSHHGARLSERERTLVRLWIDSAAVYAGTYGASGVGVLKRGEKQSPLDDPGWKESRAAAEAQARRCTACHEGERRLPVDPPDVVGVEGYTIVDEEFPRRVSNHVVFNLTRPEKSLLLLAPMAREAGGYGICVRDGKPVFSGTGDPDYQILLGIVRAGQVRLDYSRRFDMPGFRPHGGYVQMMQSYGILPRRIDPKKAPVDVYAADRAYWMSFWPRAAAR